jgi:propanediol utilization protein
MLAVPRPLLRSIYLLQISCFGFLQIAHVAEKKGAIECKEGAIRAWRHVHMSPTIGNSFGVTDGDMMAVRVKRSANIFGL